MKGCRRKSKIKTKQSRDINRRFGILEEKQVRLTYWIWKFTPLGNIKCVRNDASYSYTAWASAALTLKDLLGPQLKQL